MSAKLVPFTLNASLRQEPDQTFTILVEVIGLKDITTARQVSEWLRSTIRENAAAVLGGDTPARH